MHKKQIIRFPETFEPRETSEGDPRPWAVSTPRWLRLAQYATTLALLGMLLPSPAHAAVLTTGNVNFPFGSASEADVGGSYSVPGTGSLEINGGSVLDTGSPSPFGEIAPLKGADGSVTVTGTSSGGTPSTWNISGIQSSSPNYGAYLQDGVDGKGTLNITSGGHVSISTGSANLPPALAAGFSVGAHAGSSGTLNLLDPGSELSVNGKHAFMAVGQHGVGTMHVGNGAKMLVSGDDTLIKVGHFNSGHLTVDSDGQITGAHSLTVGSNGNGTLDLSGAGSLISLKGVCTSDCLYSSEAGVGSYLSIGALGTGVVNIDNGAHFVIDPGAAQASDGTPLTQAGFNLGGDSDIGFGGHGTLNVDGAGSKLTLVDGGFAAGRVNGGTGTINVTNGGQIVVEHSLTDTAYGLLGDVPNSGTGTMHVTGANSLVDAGNYLGVGAVGTQNAGTGTVILSNGGTVKAGEIAVGTGGSIEGDGTLTGNVVVNRGTIAPKADPGTITINGNLDFQNGVLDIHVAGTGSGQYDVLDVNGNASFTGGTIRFDFIDGFLPTIGTSIDFLKAANLASFGNMQFAYSGLGAGFRFDVNPNGSNGLTFVASNDATPAPEPGTGMLTALGLPLLGFAFAGRRRGANRGIGDRRPAAG